MKVTDTTTLGGCDWFGAPFIRIDAFMVADKKKRAAPVADRLRSLSRFGG